MADVDKIRKGGWNIQVKFDSGIFQCAVICPINLTRKCNLSSEVKIRLSYAGLFESGNQINKGFARLHPDII